VLCGIQFKGQWSKQFDPGKTYDGAFKTLDGKKQAVRLPYGSGKTSMYCILPDEGIKINEFIENMSIEKWNDIRKSISEVDEVILQIPKFKLEYGIKNLNDSLQSLGMGKLLSVE